MRWWKPARARRPRRRLAPRRHPPVANGGFVVAAYAATGAGLGGYVARLLWRAPREPPRGGPLAPQRDPGRGGPRRARRASWGAAPPPGRAGRWGPRGPAAARRPPPP